MTGSWPDGADDFVLSIADTKLMLSHWYADQAFLGPNIADNIALLSLTQDEYGHTRQLYLQLESQGRSSEWLHGDREAEEFANAATTDRPAEDWTDFEVRYGLTDRAALLMVDAIVHEDFAGLTDKIAEEEVSHVDFHDGWLEHLAAEEPAAFQVALDEALPGVLAFIGPTDYEADGDPLLEGGFTDRPVVALREAFLDLCRSLVDGTEVTVPSVDGPAMNDWDGGRRRTTAGGVDDEVLTSIRGVRNTEFAAE